MRQVGGRLAAGWWQVGRFGAAGRRWGGDTLPFSIPLKGLARCQGICSTANGVGMPLVAEHLLDARDTIVKDTTIRASGLPTAPRFGTYIARVSLFDKPD